MSLCLRLGLAGKRLVRELNIQDTSLDTSSKYYVFKCLRQWRGEVFTQSQANALMTALKNVKKLQLAKDFENDWRKNEFIKQVSFSGLRR